MASLCKRQQCTIERRGFRQELDSWRHKLIHCVGFESILEGLFGPGLVEDLTLFKDCEPEGVSDWSFDENCLFCCLRRDKVKEHLVGLSNPGLDSEPKPLLVNYQTKIHRLEKQAEEFLNAVLNRKDAPSFSDPHIPVVAREIMQRMIRQFAAEYTSKNSSSQDSPPISRPPPSDQSQPRPPSISVAPPAAIPGATAAATAHNQNPVLSKLLMADQDSPLDLTVKKPPVQPTEQDGVLDLSLKKGCSRSVTPVRSPHLSQSTSSTRVESAELCEAKAKDLQSTSTLEQFMAKLCPHHQRQIVDALGFLQTEVKAIKASSSDSQASNPPFSMDQGSVSDSLDTPARTYPDPRPLLTSTPIGPWQIQEKASVSPFATTEKIPVTAVSLHSSGNNGPPLDLRKTGGKGTKALATPLKTTLEGQSKRPSDHIPLKMKIMKSGSLANGKKLSCVLTTPIAPPSGTLWEGQVNSDSSNRAENHSARLSSPLKRHHHSGHSQQARQRGTMGHAKVTLSRPCMGERTPSTNSPMSPRTARKTIRGSSYYRPRDSSSVFIADPDLGHCDLVYIDKPITESLKGQQHCMVPRRNARKSTRGHMYVEEMWELKTVRTLASKPGRNNDLVNCPIAPMPNLTATPKALAKPDGVPPVDMHFPESCRDTISQITPTEQPVERDIPGTADVVVAAASEADLIVETSQTDQSQYKEQTTEQTLLLSARCPLVESPQSAAIESEQPRENVASEKSISQTEVEPAVQDEGRVEVLSENGQQQMKTESGVKPVESSATEEAVPQCVVEEVQVKGTESQGVVEVVQNKDTESQQQADQSHPLIENKDNKDKEETKKTEKENVIEKEGEEKEEEATEKEEEEQVMEQATEVLPQLAETQEPAENSGEERTASEAKTEQEIKGVQEMDGAKPEPVPGDVLPVTEQQKIDPLVHFSPHKSLEALLKELPPWRRRLKGQVLPKPVIISESEKIIVGYVNGRPIKASDRCLRGRSQKITPELVKRLSKGNQRGPETSLIPIPPIESTKSPSSKRSTKVQNKSSVKPTETKPEIPLATDSPADSIRRPGTKRPRKTPVKASWTTSESKSLTDLGQSRADSQSVPVSNISSVLGPETLPAPVPDSIPAPVPETPHFPASDSLPVPVLETLPTPVSESLPALVSGSLPAPIPGTPPAPVSGTPPAPVSGTPPAPIPGTPPATVPGTHPATVTGTPPAQVPGTSPAPVPGTLLAPIPGTLPAPVLGSLLAPVPGTLPAPVAGSLPAPVPGSLPAPVPGSLPAPVPGTLPAPVPGSLPTPVPGTLPAPVPGSRPAPVCEQPVSSLKGCESKRPLRSARLKLSEEVISPPQSNDLVYSISAVASSSLSAPSTESLPLRSKPLPPLHTAPSPFPLPSPPQPVSLTPLPLKHSPLPVSSSCLPTSFPPLFVSSPSLPVPPPSPHVSSPLLPASTPSLSLGSSSPPAPEQSQQNADKLRVETVQPAPDSKPSKRDKKITVKGNLQTRQKLRSSGVAKGVKKVETQQVTSEVRTVTEGPCVVKSEVQAQRSKRTLLKDREARKLTLQKDADTATSDHDKTPAGESIASPCSGRPERMPLRSASNKTEGASSHSATSATPAPQSPAENMKSALRSQRLASPSSSSAPVTAEKQREVLSPIRVKPERIMKLPARVSSPVSPQLSGSPLPSCSVLPVLPPRLEPPTPTHSKFLEALNSEDHQHLISNLNTKFDKMQKGWVQMDKEGQPAPKPKNKADRQAAIWKSKRRVRKPRSLEHQRYSPVQMLFMKNFDLKSICCWFMESTETKSLVIVKKVNTRLPSETQLCFHSSSGLPGTSQGVFPSLQAERLKKHLKKFAIASPVKSTPKSQKLIAKTLEQEVTVSKGKEKRELTTATRISTKPYTSAETQAQTAEAQKASAKAKNPASARILRKYTNIREKMQVQQTSKKMKDAPRENLKAGSVKALTTPQTTNSKPKLAAAKGPKPCLTAYKRTNEPVVAKRVRGRPPLSGKRTGKAAVQGRVAKTASSIRILRDLTKKDAESPQRSPQRPVTPRSPKGPSTLAAVAKTDSSKKHVEDRISLERSPQTKVGACSKEKQTKKKTSGRVTESRVTVGKGADSAAESARTPAMSDQVLTRSQRKMEVTPPLSASFSQSAMKKAQDPAQTESGTPKFATKKAEVSAQTQKGTPKSAMKRAQEPPQTPAKRTRMSLAK